jgi:hypothetical protein
MPSELDRLDPITPPLTLRSGLQIRVARLRLRQLFKLLRIVTRGGATYLPTLRQAMTEAPEGKVGEAFATQFLAVIIMALPEAEDEAVEFLLAVADPLHLSEGTDKVTKERNDLAQREIEKELFNPDPDDVVSILERVLDQEKDDLVSLGKRLAAMIQAANLVPSPESNTQTQTSQTGSQEHSISSQASTDGPTVRFSQPLSAD